MTLISDVLSMMFAAVFASAFIMLLSRNVTKIAVKALGMTWE